jgi:hypothetical protein
MRHPFPLVASRILVALAVVANVWVGGACRKSGLGPDGVSAFGGVSDYVLAGAITGSMARIAPSTGAVNAGAGPIVTVTGPTTVPRKNGSATYLLSAGAPFQKIFVTVNSKTGYIQLDLPSAVSSQGLELFFNTLPPDFTLQFQVAGAAGIGPITSVFISSS